MLEGHLTYDELAFFLDFFRVFLKILEIAGGSFSGRTTGSGPVNLGSNPSPPAISMVGIRVGVIHCVTNSQGNKHPHCRR